MKVNECDISIIGAGVSSVFLAYTLMKEDPQLTIQIIDIGKELKERNCDIENGGVCNCIGPCSTYVGFGGLGKSEGKFNYTNDFGGHLWKKTGKDKAMQLMHEVDAILCSFGASIIPTYSTKNKALTDKAKKWNLHVLSTEVRHLGTKLAKQVFQRMYDIMKSHISFSFETNVHSISKEENGFLLFTNRGTWQTDRVVIGTGMSGSEWLTKQLELLGIYPGKTRVDLGIRVEMKGDQLNPILQDKFETKLSYLNGELESTTYCMNPRGRIVHKYQHGLVMPDGQNAREKDKPSANLNFSFFVPAYFSSYEEAFSYAKSIIASINQKRNRIVVQRLEDFYKSRQTKKLSNNLIQPSLNGAEFGNLRDEVLELYTNTLIDFFQALENLLGEPIHEDTLLYGIDAKFYEPIVYTNEHFETTVSNLYLIGDCSGETHSLSQAAGSGIYLGYHLARQKEKNE